MIVEYEEKKQKQAPKSYKQMDRAKKVRLKSDGKVTNTVVNLV